MKTPLMLSIIQAGFRVLGIIAPTIAAKAAFRLVCIPKKRKLKEEQALMLKQANQRRVPFEKGYIQTYEWGGGSKTILLVHGWDCSTATMLAFVKPLVQEGFRVIGIDGPAHGKSPGKYTNIAHFSKAIQTILDHTDNLHGIITHSFGGLATVYALQQMLPRVTLPKLVLVGVPSTFRTALNVGSNAFALSPAVKRRFDQIAEHTIQTTISSIGMAVAKPFIKINETLVVHDEQDAVIGFSNAEQTVSILSNASLVASKGLGHNRILRAQTVIERVIRFISAKKLENIEEPTYENTTTTA